MTTDKIKIILFLQTCANDSYGSLSMLIVSLTVCSTGCCSKVKGNTNTCFYVRRVNGSLKWRFFRPFKATGRYHTIVYGNLS